MKRLIILVIIILGIAVVGFNFNHHPIKQNDKITAAKTIRCGYVPYEPALCKSPNTGEITGVFAEALEASAAKLGYKIDWAEEVTWATMIEGLENNRYDAICSAVWPNDARAQYADFTQPLYHSGVGMYAQPETNLGDIRRLATIDGEMSSNIAQEDYPQLGTVSLPQNSDVSLLLENVATGKADATFVEPYIANKYLQNTKRPLVNLAKDKPVRMFPNVMMVKKGNTKLKLLLDMMIKDALESGTVDDLLDKYDPTNGLYRIDEISKLHQPTD